MLHTHTQTLCQAWSQHTWRTLNTWNTDMVSHKWPSWLALSLTVCVQSLTNTATKRGRSVTLYTHTSVTLGPSRPRWLPGLGQTQGTRSDYIHTGLLTLPYADLKGKRTCDTWWPASYSLARLNKNTRVSPCLVCWAGCDWKAVHFEGTNKRKYGRGVV